MKQKILDESIGWYGMLAIISTYALANFNILSTSDILYQLLNITGASGLVYISFKKKAYQPGVLNIIWALIALIAIYRLLI